MQNRILSKTIFLACPYNYDNMNPNYLKILDQYFVFQKIPFLLKYNHNTFIKTTCEGFCLMPVAPQAILTICLMTGINISPKEMASSSNWLFKMVSCLAKLSSILYGYRESTLPLPSRMTCA